jgi:hypothetical protein
MTESLNGKLGLKPLALTLTQSNFSKINCCVFRLRLKNTLATKFTDAASGKKPADRNMNCESAKEFPLQRQENKAVKLNWRVEAMKLSTVGRAPARAVAASLCRARGRLVSTRGDDTPTGGADPTPQKRHRHCRSPEVHRQETGPPTGLLESRLESAPERRPQANVLAALVWRTTGQGAGNPGAEQRSAEHGCQP